MLYGSQQFEGGMGSSSRLRSDAPEWSSRGAMGIGRDRGGDISVNSMNVSARRTSVPKSQDCGSFAQISTRDIRGGHTKAIRDLGYSMSGGKLGTTSDDDTTRMWHVDWGYGDLRPVTTLSGQGDSSVCLCWDPTSESCLCTASSGGEIRLWDTRTGKVIQKMGQNSTTEQTIGLVWSNDGFYLGMNNNNNGVHLFDVRAWKRIKRFKYPSALYGMAWSPNGQHLIVTSCEGTFGGACDFMGIQYPTANSVHVERWQSVTGHNGPCLSIAVDPAGMYFATGGADGVAAVWSFQDLSCIGTMNRLTMDVNSVSFSRGGEYLACASKASSKIDIAHRDNLQKACELDGVFHKVAWHPSELLLIGVLAGPQDGMDDYSRSSSSRREKDPMLRCWTFDEKK